MAHSVSAIIVTHNSEKYLRKCINAIELQSCRIDQIIVVDCGSPEKNYLQAISRHKDVQVLETGNIGFAKANNLGYRHRKNKCEYVLFLNPDTFLSSTFIEKAIHILKNNEDVGIVSGKLLGFDIEQNTSTHKIDSTGIFRKYYGRWYDRGQNEIDAGQYSFKEKVPALCGALLFCREAALKSLGENIFDPDFFLYKEDIELGLRLREKGWSLLYHPGLTASHCRGWNTSRKSIPYERRKISSYNEILLYRKHPSPYLIWALIKYFLVITCKI